MSTEELRRQLAGLADGLPPGQVDPLAAVTRRVRRRRKLRALTAAGSAALIVVVALVVGVPGTRGGTQEVTARPPGLAIHSYHVGSNLSVSAMAVDGDSVWLAGSSTSCSTKPCGGRVERLGASSGRTDPGIPIAKDPIAIAVGGGAVWVLADSPDGSPYQLSRIDAAANKVTLTTDIPASHVTGNTNPMARLAVGAGSVWVTFYDGTSHLVRINPRTGQTSATMTILVAVGALSANGAGVWAAEDGGGRVMRIDPVTEVSDTIDTGAAFMPSLATDSTSAWVTATFPKPGGSASFGMVRIDSSPVRIGLRSTVSGYQVAAGDGQVWIIGYSYNDTAAGFDPGYVGLLDQHTGAVVASTHLTVDRNGLVAAGVGHGAAWIVDATSGVVTRVAQQS
jgi:hypothetical protein